MSKWNSDSVLVPAAGSGVLKINTLTFNLPRNVSDTCQLDRTRTNKIIIFLGEIILDLRSKCEINVRQLTRDAKPVHCYCYYFLI